MRGVKTAEEISHIQHACKITDDIFSAILTRIHSQMTEIQVRDMILVEIQKRKLIPSFPPIVTSSAHAGNAIHPESTNDHISGFVIIDLGVVYKGYCSDMTRTMYVGSPTGKEISYYNRVLKAKILAESVALPGVRTSYPDMCARESLKELNSYFIHTLGHGVGKKIHEFPKLYKKYNRFYLRENMVITIEPGIYIPNTLGIRIEDTGIVTKNGFKSLTHSIQDLVIIPN